MDNSYIRLFENLNSNDVPIVGGKNASLGEMIQNLKQEGVRVPDGFATTAQAYWEFIEANQIKAQIKSLLHDLETEKQSLSEVGKAIRRLFKKHPFLKM